MTSNTQTDYRFKLLYAIGIIIIVAGHLEHQGFSLAFELFPPYAFHLGLFVFASGYLYKEASGDTPGKYILKKAKQLLLPLYLWNFAYAAVITILSYAGFTFGSSVNLESLFILPITDGHQFSFTLSGWFIIPLFIIQVLNVLFRNLCSKLRLRLNETVIFVCSMLLGIAGVYLASQGYNTGLWLTLVRVLYFVPFFSLGIFYRKVLEKYDTLPSIWYFAIVIGLKLLIIYIYKRAPVYTPSWCNNFTDGPILPFIVGFLGIAFWFRIVKILTPVLGKNKYVNLIANNTYSIMINHIFAIFLINSIFAFMTKDTQCFLDFDWNRYFSDVSLVYCPFGIEQTGIIFLIAGIVLPILAQYIINLCWNQIRKLFSNTIGRN